MTRDDDTGDVGATVSIKPAWLAPVVVVVIVISLALAARKKEEAVENPIVDGAVITVIVFAFAAVYRWAFTKMGAPGAVTFFGGPVQPHPASTTVTADASGY